MSLTSSHRPCSDVCKCSFAHCHCMLYSPAHAGNDNLSGKYMSGILPGQLTCSLEGHRSWPFLLEIMLWCLQHERRTRTHARTHFLKAGETQKPPVITPQHIYTCTITLSSAHLSVREQLNRVCLWSPTNLGNSRHVVQRVPRRSACRLQACVSPWAHSFLSRDSQ